MKVGLLYAAFSALSIIVNIFTQVLVVSLIDLPLTIPLSVLTGTITGLIAKYALDKRWIFRFAPRDRAEEVGTFVQYTATGLLTTGVFWGTEYLFHVLLATDLGRYLGGVLGLTIGYSLKYHLDKHFVFKRTSA